MIINLHNALPHSATQSKPLTEAVLLKKITAYLSEHQAEQPMARDLKAIMQLLKHRIGLAHTTTANKNAQDHKTAEQACSEEEEEEDDDENSEAFIPGFPIIFSLSFALSFGLTLGLPVLTNMIVDYLEERISVQSDAHAQKLCSALQEMLSEKISSSMQVSIEQAEVLVRDATEQVNSRLSTCESTLKNDEIRFDKLSADLRSTNLLAQENKENQWAS